jgi:hypothetical protein
MRPTSTLSSAGPAPDTIRHVGEWVTPTRPIYSAPTGRNVERGRRREGCEDDLPPGEPVGEGPLALPAGPRGRRATHRPAHEESPRVGGRYRGLSLALGGAAATSLGGWARSPSRCALTTGRGRRKPSLSEIGDMTPAGLPSPPRSTRRKPTPRLCGSSDLRDRAAYSRSSGRRASEPPGASLTAIGPKAD